MNLFGGVTLKFDDCYKQPKGGKHIAHALFLNQLHMYFNSSAIFKLQNKLHQIVSMCFYADVQINIDELTKAKTKKILSTKVQTHHAFNYIQLHSIKPK
jgi:hypothetical protein